MALEFAEVLRHILLAFLVLVLLFGVCLSSSSSHQDSEYSYNDKSNKHGTRSLPFFERYIVKSYFREYDSLVDSNFQDYVAHRLPLDSGKVVPRLLDLERHLIGEGYHRRLSSSVRFSIDPYLIPGFSTPLCEVIIIERLPSGIFADPFELEHLLQYGAFTDASVFGDTNLELPAFLSNRSVVEVHLDAALKKSAGQEIVHEFKIDIPLHARYPGLEESGYSKVIFGVPDLFISCKMHGKFAPKCLLTPFASNDSLKLDDVVWSIPAGIKAHARIVSVVTFASALLSAISIIIVSFQHSRLVSDDRLKQS